MKKILSLSLLTLVYSMALGSAPRRYQPQFIHSANLPTIPNVTELSETALQTRIQREPKSKHPNPHTLRTKLFTYKAKIGTINELLQNPLTTNTKTLQDQLNWLELFAIETTDAQDPFKKELEENITKLKSYINSSKILLHTSQVESTSLPKTQDPNDAEDEALQQAIIASLVFNNASTTSRRALKIDYRQLDRESAAYASQFSNIQLLINKITSIEQQHGESPADIKTHFLLTHLRNRLSELNGAMNWLNPINSSDDEAVARAATPPVAECIICYDQDSLMIPCGNCSTLACAACYKIIKAEFGVCSVCTHPFANLSMTEKDSIAKRAQNAVLADSETKAFQEQLKIAQEEIAHLKTTLKNAKQLPTQTPTEFQQYKDRLLALQQNHEMLEKQAQEKLKNIFGDNFNTIAK